MTVALLAACKSATPAATGPLGEVAGFSGGAVEQHDSYARREYRRGDAKISVTRAASPTTDAQFEHWKQMSASFPEAQLGPDASGFYQCAESDADNCDLLVQTRAGVHFELRAGGTAHRRDLDALFAGMR
jgi:hypothetical protein